MLRLKPVELEATEFVARVQDVVNGAAKLHRPSEFTVIRVDNWFGSRWLEFSGKMIGAIGVRMKTLTFPPFVPSRLHSAGRFVRDESLNQYSKIEGGRSPHRWQTSSQNLHYRPSEVAPKGAYFWFSGQSGSNGRGALMAYISTPDDWWAWYAGFMADHDWRAIQTIGITEKELRDLEVVGRDAA